jgi:hypothetical protein
MATFTLPKLLSIATATAIVLVLLSFPLLFMPSIKKLGDFIPMILGIVITLQFVALIGVWHMKRWGVELFIIMFFTRLLLFMLLELYGFRFYFNLAYSTIFSFCFLAYYKKMDTNL